MDLVHVRILLTFVCKQDVAENVFEWKKYWSLEEHSNFPLLAWLFFDVFSIENDCSFGWFQEARNGSQQGGLPAPPRADYGNNVARFHLKIKV